MYTIPGRSYQLWSPVTAEIEPFEYIYSLVFVERVRRLAHVSLAEG